MKKALFFSVATLMLAVQMNAQKKVTYKQSNALVEKTLKKGGLQKQAPIPTNAPKVFKSLFTLKDGSVAQNFNYSAKSSDQILEAQEWGHFINADTNEYQMFSMDTEYGSDAVNSTITFLNEQSIQSTKSFHVSFPSTANYVSALGQISQNIGDNSLTKVMVFVHYFEGGMGPEFAKNQVWIVDEAGAILTKIDAQSVDIFKDSEGNQKLLTYSSNEDNATVALYDKNFNQLKSFDISGELLNYYLGDPMRLLKMNGEQKIIISHYEKVLMDNDTFELTPDNHLTLEIYNTDLDLEKTIPVDMSSIYDNPFILPQAKFGVFYFNNQYDVTNHTFNTDDNNEFFYQIEFYDLMQDKTWNHYYVANEEGQRILSLEVPIFDSYPLVPMTGEDNQVGLITGSLDDEEGGKDGGGGTSIDMFSIESWTQGASFPAMINGQQLTSYFNRVPSANGYSYVIGINEGKIENGETYGLVNQYSKTATFEKEIKLPVAPNPDFFMPLLDSDYMDPKLFNNDSDVEFTYISKHPSEGGMLYNTLSIAKDSQAPIFSISGDATKGNLLGSGFVIDKAGDQFIKLAIVHDQDFTGTSLTEFFDIPFTTLATDGVKLSNVAIFTDQTNQIVGWTSKASTFEIYDMTGKLVKKGNNASQTSTAYLNKGMYIVKLVVGNEILAKKFIVK